MTSVITALFGYSIDTIKPFVESLNLTGFKGTKVVIYYNPDKEVKKYLENNNWNVYPIPENKYHINLERFKEIPKVIEKYNLSNDTICFTDIRDVIFKKDPSEIKTNFYIGADIFKPFTQHEWNAKAITDGFPNKLDIIKEEYPLCAGVIIGNGALLKNFFTDCFSISIQSLYSNLVEWCAVDQAAVNILAYTKYKDTFQYPKLEDKIVFNTANRPIKDAAELDGYYIYHQYDRNEIVKNYLLN